VAKTTFEDSIVGTLGRHRAEDAELIALCERRFRTMTAYREAEDRCKGARRALPAHLRAYPLHACVKTEIERFRDQEVLPWPFSPEDRAAIAACFEPLLEEMERKAAMLRQDRAASGITALEDASAALLAEVVSLERLIGGKPARTVPGLAATAAVVRSRIGAVEPDDADAALVLSLVDDAEAMER
jgi:hypothetical protein